MERDVGAEEHVNEAGFGARRWCHAPRLACDHTLARGHSPWARAARRGRKQARQAESIGLPRASAPAIVSSRSRVEWRKRLGVEPSPPAISGRRPILKTGRATGPRSLPSGRCRRGRLSASYRRGQRSGDVPRTHLRPASRTVVRPLWGWDPEKRSEGASEQRHDSGTTEAPAPLGSGAGR